MVAGRYQKSRDTLAELRVRKALREVGLVAYETHKTIKLPRWAGREQHTTPDVVLPLLALYVDGCYWHGCPLCFRDTATNTAAWRSRRARNRARDQRHARALETLGWRVLRLWEHEDAAAGARAAQAILETDAPPGTYGLP